MGFSDYWENKVLDYMFGKGSLTPTPIFVGLSSSDPTDDGSALAEPGGNNYARVQTSACNWKVASGGVLTNAGQIVFAMATGGWGTVTHFALFDDATGGNMLAYGPLGESKTIGSGDIARFAAGEMEINLD
jgi:hypothetical protein